MRRDELAGHPLRAERPFRLLVATPDGERLFAAEALLDASGVYGQPLAIGAGGVAAPGERALGDRDRASPRRAACAARRVGATSGCSWSGNGHSAAHAAALLAASVQSLTWAVRSANTRPVADVAADPLPERAAVVRARQRSSRRRRRRTSRSSGARTSRRWTADGGALVVTLSGERRVVVDEIVALTGYRPDVAMASELAVELAPATEGAARLYRAMANITDCLRVPTLSARDLESGEPGFALVGHKSYGRSRAFLLQTGLAQLEAIVAAL